jgi:hypothetical protein
MKGSFCLKHSRSRQARAFTEPIPLAEDDPLMCTYTYEYGYHCSEERVPNTGYCLGHIDTECSFPSGGGVCGERTEMDNRCSLHEGLEVEEVPVGERYPDSPPPEGGCTKLMKCTTGKKWNVWCGVEAVDEGEDRLCSFHYNIANMGKSRKKLVDKCEYVLLRGPRKGDECGKSSLGSKCSSHKKNM